MSNAETGIVAGAQATATEAAGGSAADAGSSKHPLADGGGEEGGDSKRQRRESHGEAGPSGKDGAAPAPAAAAAGGQGGEDPLDRVPDAPMHLMRVRDIPSWANEGFLGVKVGDLVRGDMLWCMVSNYMLDTAWLLSACPDLRRAGKVVLVHGEQAGTDKAQQIAKDVQAAGLGKRCITFAPPLPIEWGTHHSKAFIVHYQRGLRVVILTANAICKSSPEPDASLDPEAGADPDCNNKSQGLFWQDFPPKDSQSPQTSPFEQDLAAYLRALRLPPTVRDTVRKLLAAHDFSAARGHILASVPGYHKGTDVHKWGHMRLRALLNREPPWPAAFKEAPLVAQYSSLGSLTDKWLNEFRASMSAGQCQDADGSRARLGLPLSGAAGLQLVWPAVGEIQNSIEGWASGNSVPGTQKNVTRPFLLECVRRWGGEVCGRQRAMPHIKSFLRYRPLPGISNAAGGGAGGGAGAEEEQEVEVAWMLVTSHNLSAAAWGALQKDDSQLFIRSYELGVLLTPSREAAYRASRWRGFICTSSQPMPAAAGAAAAGAAAAAAGGAAAPAAGEAGAATAGRAAGGTAGTAAVAAAAGEQGQVPVVSFRQWRRGTLQDAGAATPAGGGGDAGSQVLRVPLPIPYRLPPRRYEAGEQAWDWNTNWPGLDSLGSTRA